MAAPDPTAHIAPILFAIAETTVPPAWQQPVPDPNTGPTSFGLGSLVPPVVAGNHVYVAWTEGLLPPQNGQFLLVQRGRRHLATRAPGLHECAGAIRGLFI